jgi:hypothetical protein
LNFELCRLALPPVVRNGSAFPHGWLLNLGCAFSLELESKGVAQKLNGPLYGKAEPFLTTGGKAKADAKTSSKLEVPSSKLEVPSSKLEVPSSKLEVPSSKLKVPSSQVPTS